MRVSILPLIALAVISAAAAPPTPRFRIAPTVSAEAARDLAPVFAVNATLPPPVRPVSLDDWDRQNAAIEQRFAPRSKAYADKLGVIMTDDRIGGVPVVRLRPAGYRPGGPLLIYLHGGAYTRFSAHAEVIPAALIASATRDEVISVDYTLAPRARWQAVTDQIISVWRALLAAHIAPRGIGLFGDSAGGGLAAGSVLKMRDLGLPLPGALYLMSPASDETHIGDSIETLAALDPMLNLESVSWSAAAYADPADQKNPYVSPVYGDYSKPFPPTLIQGGTREMLLSNFVRQYQAIRSGGHEAVLDLYEGMPHVFQGMTPGSPETRTAIARAAAFFDQHLHSR